MEMIEVRTIFNDVWPLAEKKCFEWHGGDRVMIAMNLVEDLPNITLPLSVGSEFSIGPFRVKVTEIDFAYDAAIVVRQYNLLSSLKYFYYKTLPTIDLIYRRAIITLAVWRLATVERYTIPTWQNINLFKK